MALRLLIERVFGADVRQAPLTAGAHGKPCISGLAGDFNLAHTGGLALIAAGRNACLGVDLELERSLRLSQPRRLILETAAERLAPDWALPPVGNTRTLQAWARLEAAAKATGRGIGRTLADLGVWGAGRALDGCAPERAGVPEGTRGPDGALIGVVDLDLGPDRFAALAGTGVLAAPRVARLPESEAALEAMRHGAAIADNSGVDLAPAPPHKGPVRSVAQPG